MNISVIPYRKHATASCNLRLDKKFLNLPQTSGSYKSTFWIATRENQGGRECPPVISV